MGNKIDDEKKEIGEQQKLKLVSYRQTERSGIKQQVSRRRNLV
jgi:hypothetical protein